MIQIRQGLFETNSSSTHSLTMCTSSDFEDWKSGKLIYDFEEEELIPATEEILREKEMGDDYKRYMTYENFNDWSYLEYESFEQRFKTPGGEEVVGFGYFGYD